MTVAKVTAAARWLASRTVNSGWLALSGESSQEIHIFYLHFEICLFLICSNGVGCSGHGVYTRVTSFEKWIADTIAKN